MRWIPSVCDGERRAGEKEEEETILRSNHRAADVWLLPRLAFLRTGPSPGPAGGRKGDSVSDHSRGTTVVFSTPRFVNMTRRAALSPGCPCRMTEEKEEGGRQWGWVVSRLIRRLAGTRRGRHTKIMSRKKTNSQKLDLLLLLLECGSLICSSQIIIIMMITKRKEWHQWRPFRKNDPR